MGRNGSITNDRSYASAKAAQNEVSSDGKFMWKREYVTIGRLKSMKKKDLIIWQIKQSKNW